MQPETLMIEVYGTPGSIEYQAALLLHDLIRNACGPEDRGSVAIHTDLYFPGQRREQIDLLLHAHFPDRFSRRLRLDGADTEQEVTFQDIVAVIEVKAHRRENVLFSGTNAEVLYNGVWKSASAQSHEQVHSVKPFLKRELGWSPWICNLIFFTNLSEEDLPAGSRNYLARDSSFDSLLERLCLSRKLTTLQAQSGTATFSCVPARDQGQRSARNEELKRLLRTERVETAMPPAPPKPPYTPRRYWQAPYSPPRSFRPAWKTPRRRRGLALFKLLMAVLVVAWVVTAATHKDIRIRSSADFSSATQHAAPILRTCVMVTPSCYCDASTSFRKGRTVVVQFLGKRQRPVDPILREPNGNTMTLNFRNLNLSPKYFEGSCFIAKHALRKDAPLGSYSVQTTAANPDGSPAGALSIGFQVTR